jgi:hypothetical protein
VITQLVAGAVTEHVFAGFRATPELSRAVTVYEVGDSPAAGPTVIVAAAFPATTETVGGLSGVVPATTFEVRPAFPFSARIATWYVVPFVRFVISIGETASAGDIAVQVTPPSSEYS